MSLDDLRGARHRQAHYRHLAADPVRAMRKRTAWHLAPAPREDERACGRLLPRADRCRIAVLTADHRPRGPWRIERDLLGPGALYYRAACLRCDDFEGPARERENDAVEDAHDHVFPGWRKLPVLEPLPYDATDRARSRWIEQAVRAYPAGWFDQGGPILTYRNPGGTRHVPGRAPGGGYDMARPRPLALSQRQRPGRTGPTQDELF
ncbi:DUF6349 family protein [Nonomuraea typhae]|uniref:DUF6349 family protein n=1 Tax=Nonomuraea typhae TaxID=2603600 RepID=UPI0012F9948A|nr:DUF6349 family protein [Nonomuraea typhae]